MFPQAELCPRASRGHGCLGLRAVSNPSPPPGLARLLRDFYAPADTTRTRRYSLIRDSAIRTQRPILIRAVSRPCGLITAAQGGATGADCPAREAKLAVLTLSQAILDAREPRTPPRTVTRPSPKGPHSRVSTMYVPVPQWSRNSLCVPAVL